MNRHDRSGKRRHMLRRIMVAVLIVMLSMWGLPPSAGLAEDKAANTLQETVGLSDEARAAAYEKLRFAMQEWTPGLVLSRHPFAVVTEVHETGEALDEVAIVRIWTGLIARVDDDLVVVWDELRLDAGGAVASMSVAQSKLLPDYFAEANQRTYRNVGFVGLYPWAYIPTDPEAVEAGVAPVAQGGIIDLYGYDFGDATVNMQDAGSVGYLPAIPARITDRLSYATRAVDDVPADIAGHWAEPYTLSLMRLGIVDGYGDGTIRPAQALTRAEFIKLALSAALFPPESRASGYADVTGHWAEPYLSAAEAHGVIPQGDGVATFEPNEPVSRAEMAVMLHGVLQALLLPLPEAPQAFPDTDGLDETTRNAIEAVAGYGILSGFGDGTFRPDEPLTRAQAFVAIAKLAEWL